MIRLPAPAPAAETVALPGHGSVELRWRRNARARRITLRVDPAAGALVLSLPARASRAAGLQLLLDHAGWVSARLAALPPPIVLQDGGSVPVHGIPHRIRHDPAQRPGIRDGEIVVSGDPAFLPRRVADLLRAEARRSLGASAAASCARAGLVARRVSIKDTASRWGSCAADGTLMFCWRLVMCPPWVQDYVAAHEVAHLRHMNHSPAFWAAVAELNPDRDRASAWLKANGAALLRVQRSENAFSTT